MLLRNFDGLRDSQDFYPSLPPSSSRMTSSSLSPRDSWHLLLMSSSLIRQSSDKTAMCPGVSNITTSFVSPSLGSSIIAAVKGAASPFVWTSLSSITGFSIETFYSERRPVMRKTPAISDGGCNTTKGYTSEPHTKQLGSCSSVTGLLASQGSQ